MSQADGHAGPLTTLEQVEDLIAAAFGRPVVALAAETLLDEDLRIDALSMAVLVCAVEDHFGLSLPDGVAERFRSVGDLVAWIDAQMVARRIER